MNLAIIGGGNMGGAMAHSLLATQTIAPSKLMIIELVSTLREDLAQALGCAVRENIDDEISRFYGILLAVKPQNASAVMQDLAPFLASNQVVISIMAGISIEQMIRELNHRSIVRAMPNTPAQIGEGMSIYYGTRDLSSAQLQFTQSILNANGRAFSVDQEDAIDAATAISGSGPAYVFYIAEQMMACAIKFGFSREQASLLTQQTIKGAVLLWEKQSIPVDELRHRVTSPGGTTEAALRSFEQSRIGILFQEGLRAAYLRAKELAQSS